MCDLINFELGLNIVLLLVLYGGNGCNNSRGGLLRILPTTKWTLEGMGDD